MCALYFLTVTRHVEWKKEILELVDSGGVCVGNRSKRRDSAVAHLRLTSCLGY
jgi:hypothetical protein